MAFIPCVLFSQACIIAAIVVSRWGRYRIPGPRGVPFLGQSIDFVRASTKGILPLLKRWKERYGDIHKMEILGMKYVVLSAPETAAALLSSTINVTKGSRENSLMKPWLKNGLLTSDSNKWRARRKLLTPCFHQEILELSLDSVYRNAQSLAEILLTSGGKAVEIDDPVHLSSLKIICETALGVKLNSEEKEQNEFIRALNDVAEGIVIRHIKFWLFMDFIYRLSKPGKSFFKSLDIVHKFSKQVISERRKIFQSQKTAMKSEENMEKEQRKVFLDTLLELEYSNPDLFSEDDIREEVDTLIFAGEHSSSKAIIFSHFLLANHPNVQEKAYNEQKEIFGDDERMPTKEDLQKMTYLEMVINETLRLYPSVPLITRTLIQDLKIGNKIIPADQTAVVMTYFIHRSEEHWPDPEEFIPERFAPGIKRHPFSYIPFSTGPRNCLGQNFAMMEIKTILSTILRKCRLEPVTTSVSLDYAIVIKPVEPIKIIVFPRS